MQPYPLVTLPASEVKRSVSWLLSYQELDILHTLRGFCAFYVVIYHAKYVLWSGGTEYLKAFPRATWNLLQYLLFVADMASSAGYEMVIFFFVLSGFFIRYAQLKKHRPTFRFYLNRIVRIYPPYLASVLLAGGVLAYLAIRHPALLTAAAGREFNASLLGAWQDAQHMSILNLARVLAFLKTKLFFWGENEVYWSLLPEALFYLLVPLAFWRIRYYYVFSAVCYVAGLLAPTLHTSSYLGEFMFLYNGYFALGAGLYDVVTTQPGWLAVFRRMNGLLLLVVLTGVLALLVVTAALHLRTVSGLLAASLAILSVFVLLAGRVQRKNFIVRALHEVGIFSFSLYLYHFPLLILSYAGLVWLTGDLVNYTRYYWLALPLVTAGCYALYLVTEKPAVRFFRGT